MRFYFLNLLSEKDIPDVFQAAYAFSFVHNGTWRDMNPNIDTYWRSGYDLTAIVELIDLDHALFFLEGAKFGFPEKYEAFLHTWRDEIVEAKNLINTLPAKSMTGLNPFDLLHCLAKYYLLFPQEEKPKLKEARDHSINVLLNQDLQYARLSDHDIENFAAARILDHKRVDKYLDGTKFIEKAEILMRDFKEEGSWYEYVRTAAALKILKAEIPNSDDSVASSKSFPLDNKIED